MSRVAELGDADDLVAGLLKGAPSDPFVFRKVQEDGTIKDYAIRVKYLRLEQNHQVLREAQAYAKQQGEAPDGYGDLYREAQSVELLTLALCRTQEHALPDGTRFYPPLFTSSQQLRLAFNGAEMAQCLNMYELVKSKYGAIESFSEDDLALWRARLADRLRGPFFLSLLDSGHWPQLIFALAQEAQDLRSQLGLPLSTSLDSLASDPASSAPSTGSFSELPSGTDADGNPLPTDHIMSADEARERSKRITTLQK